MSSVYSMREVDGSPRRFPWRIILVLSCLLGAAYVCRYAAPPVLRDYRADRRYDTLLWGGTVAEEVEQQYDADAPPDADALAQSITPIFDQEPTLAYARIWDPAGHLRYVYSRTNAELPEMGIRGARARAKKLVTAPQTLEDIAHMQTLLHDQSELSDTMDAALKAGRAVGSHNDLYIREDDIAQLTADLAARHPLLSDAVDSMHQALDGLTGNNADALAGALHGATAAETDLTRALEDLRATTDVVKSLPPDLARYAPAPATLWQRLWPAVRARRIVVPLFTPAVNEALVAPVGMAEIGIYDRPADLAALLAARCWPALLLLLLALITPFLPRRKETPPPVEPVESSPRHGG